MVSLLRPMFRKRFWAVWDLSERNGYESIYMNIYKDDNEMERKIVWMKKN